MMTKEYDQVCEEGLWLEDHTVNRIVQCSRFNYPEGSEESVWVCHGCCEVIDDPSEHECEEDL